MDAEIHLLMRKLPLPVQKAIEKLQANPDIRNTGALNGWINAYCQHMNATVKPGERERAQLICRHLQGFVQ